MSPSTLGPTLETARLILRPPMREDFEAYAATLQDEKTARFIGGVSPPEAAWRAFASMVGSWVLQGFGAFTVIEKASGARIGRVGPLQPLGWPGTEVGWTLARPFWGKGYAVEAATAAIDWAFDTLGWSDVIHCIEPANAPSIAVATRLGSRKLRSQHLPPPFEDTLCDIYGQSREQWRARRRRAD